MLVPRPCLGRFLVFCSCCRPRASTPALSPGSGFLAAEQSVAPNPPSVPRAQQRAGKCPPRPAASAFAAHLRTPLRCDAVNDAVSMRAAAVLGAVVAPRFSARRHGRALPLFRRSCSCTAAPSLDVAALFAAHCDRVQDGAAQPAAPPCTHPPLNADFTHPAVAVRECATGRGLFAVSTIPADTLLVASTAFALSSDGLEALPAAVCQRLRSRPDLGPALYELSPGPGFGAPPLGEAASGVDAARIAAICAENAFCAVDEVEAAVLTERWAEREARRDGTGRPSSVELNVRSDGLQRAVGLWLSPASMINHSCAPSCEWFAIGATLFVVARRAVAAGEELSIAYVDVAPGEAARGAALGLRFACACSRCACERLHDGPAWEAAAARLASRTARHRGGPRAAAGGAQPTALLRSYAAALRARAPPPARAPLVRLSALAGDTALLEGRFAAAAACHERAARLAPAALGAGGAPPAAAAALLAAALCSARAGDAARARGAVERLAAARCAPHAPWARLAPGDLLYLARAHARLDPHAAPLLDALFEQPRRAGGATGDAAAPPVAEVHRYRQ